MKKKKRTHNIQRIKTGDSYFIPEICERLKVHKNTVREWMRRGLTRIDDRRPYMILGSVLKDYLRLKQSSRKHKCKPEEFYCCRCRQPRRARAGIIDITIRTAKILNLSGTCEQCGCSVNKGASLKKLADIIKIFTVRDVRNRHLIDDSALNQLIGRDDNDLAGDKK